MAADVQSFIAQLGSLQASSPLAGQISRLSDGVHEENVILKMLSKRSKKPLTTGGALVEFKIKYNRRRMQAFYGGTELSTEHPEFIKDCSLYRVYKSIDVSYYLTDLIENGIGGKDKTNVTNYVSEKIDDAKEDSAYTVTQDILGDGSTSGDGIVISGDPRQIIGLGRAVETVPTAGNSYGGHTRSASTTWLNNQTHAAGTIGGITTDSMLELLGKCSHGTKKPDLIVCSDVAWRKVHGLVKSDTQIFLSQPVKQVADWGFEHINFMGIPVVSDKNMTGVTYGGVLSAGSMKRMYFLNCKDGLELRVNPKYDFTLQDTIKLGNSSSASSTTSRNALAARAEAQAGSTRRT